MELLQSNKMVKRDELIQFIHQTIGSDLLEKVQKIDGHANGVQIHGSQDVEKVSLGVSASLDFFKEAVADGAQFCIFHHGIGLTDRHLYNSRFSPDQQARLKYVFDNDLTIAGYHASLDMHKRLGNNAIIIEKLGAKRLDEPYHEEWGWVGEFDKARDVKEIAQKCSDIFEHDIFAIYAGPEKIKRIGVCSGGAKPYGSTLHEIIEKNVDLHISGEISESGPGMAKDTGINYFSCGHYASEVFGVQALGNAIKDHFKDKVEVEFIDISNPL